MKAADLYKRLQGNPEALAALDAQIGNGTAKPLRARQRGSRQGGSGGASTSTERPGGGTAWPGEVFIETLIPSMANLRLNPWDRASEVRRLRELVNVVLWKFDMPPMPVVVTFTRLSKFRPLDDDNLSASCKSCRDSVAKKFGVDDGSPLYTWRYEQEKAKESGLKIAIRTRTTP